MSKVHTLLVTGFVGCALENEECVVHAGDGPSGNAPVAVAGCLVCCESSGCVTVDWLLCKPTVVGFLDCGSRVLILVCMTDDSSLLCPGHFLSRSSASKSVQVFEFALAVFKS